MKFAYVAYDRPDYHAGPIVVAQRLLPALKRRGHEPVALIVHHKSGAPNAERMLRDGIDCRLLPWPPYTEQLVDWMLHQLAELETEVFVPNLSVAGFFAARWARAAGIPTMGVMASPDEFHWGMVSEFVLGEDRWALSAIVCVNPVLQKQVAAYEPKLTRLFVAEPGTPIPPETSKQTDAISLAYAGRLVRDAKRVNELVEAIARVSKVVPNLTATLYGDGPERERLQSTIISQGVSDRVVIAGAVSPDKIQGCLLDHQVFVLLSDFEGTPGAVMDAMACGLVPVCLDIPGGVQELVIHEETGLLVSDRGPSFVQAIERLAQDRELRIRLGANARQHIIDNFSLEMAAERWEHFCEELLAEAGPKRPLEIPDRLDLPPVHSALAREDRRRPNALGQLLNKISWSGAGFRRRLLNR